MAFISMSLVENPNQIATCIIEDQDIHIKLFGCIPKTALPKSIKRLDGDKFEALIALKNHDFWLTLDAKGKVINCGMTDTDRLTIETKDSLNSFVCAYEYRVVGSFKYSDNPFSPIDLHLNGNDKTLTPNEIKREHDKLVFLDSNGNTYTPGKSNDDGQLIIKKKHKRM